MIIQPLTNQELEKLAPSLFTAEPCFEASDKYHFISTISVVDEIRSYGWYPVSASESSVRDEAKEGFQQHCVRFRQLDDFLNPGQNVLELLLFNSHDRSNKFSISAGIYRFVCANGLVVADSVFESYDIKHIGDKENEVKNAVDGIVKAKEKIMDKITLFEHTMLNESEKESFARASIPLRFEKHLQVNYKDLLEPHRISDDKNDLYTVFNTIQEHLIRGNLSGINKITGRRFTSKEIKSISTDAQINKSLWQMAENIAKIKQSQAA